MVLLEMVLQVVGPPLLLLRSFSLLLQASFRIIRPLDVDCRTVRKNLKGFSKSVLRPKAVKKRLFVCATFRGMQPAEKDINFNELQAVVDDALKKALGPAECHQCWDKRASIRPFGSRAYGLATRTSDADYWMPLPERHARAAKVIRAYCSVATLSFA